MLSSARYCERRRQAAPYNVSRLSPRFLRYLALITIYVHASQNRSAGDLTIHLKMCINYVQYFPQ